MTELVYFMTWDEVPEGVDLTAFGFGMAIEGIFKKKNNRLFKRYPDSDWSSALDLSDYSDVKYIPTPIDKPKPNSWDEYLTRNGGFFTGGAMISKDIIGSPRAQSAIDFLSQDISNE